MPQVISHWWGTEAIFSKTEKDELIGAILAVESGVLSSYFADLVAPEVVVPLAIAVAALWGDLAAMNLVGTGGFRILIPWITPPSPLPPAVVLPNF